MHRRHAQELLDDAMAFMDPYWDEAAGLLWSPGDVAVLGDPRPDGRHLVRNSDWYALGLFMRNEGRDLERALRTLGAILTYQFDTPGRPYHGTFRRAPEEALPPAEAAEWLHYDPNWREFIITTLSIILAEYAELLPRELQLRIDGAIRRAVEGALERPLRAAYTNIALMHAYMLCFAGERLGEPGWFERGEQMAQEVYRLFKRHDSFEEYNSPTYYGTDLYSLALWRGYAPSPLLRRLGAEMEALLWADIGRFYHAGLRNLCGPYDRAYGMDMRRYVAAVGQWIRLVTGREQAPLPALERPFAHAADWCYATCAAILGVRVPEGARGHLIAFQGERQVERVISDEPRRLATAWLAPGIMLGAEHTSGAKQGYKQFHPATVHWQAGDDVGWIRLLHAEPVDARASPNRLTIAGTREAVFQISAPGAQREGLRAGLWRLPGLDVEVEASAAMWVEERGGCLEVGYQAGAGQPIACTLTTRLA